MSEATRSTPPLLALVVDDEPEIRRFLRTGLEMRGFRVVEAQTAREAIELAVMRAPDLVVLDLGLPDADGASVLAELRSWSKVPVIVLSVRGSEAEKVALLEAGADDYIVKPFGMAELLARAGVVLHRQLMRELWPLDPDEDVQYLRILMKKLRNRIEPDPARPIYVVTELAVGYRLRTQEQFDAAGYAMAMP